MTQPALPTQSQTAVFCSVIIPTIGRDKLTRAVESVLAQEVNETFEVIVVNDSGQPLSKEAWQKDGRVQIIDTNKRERCVARNTGAALAHGRYLHFLDDDDWLLPGALAALARLSQEAPDADWLYGSTQLVNRNGEKIIELHHHLAGNSFTQVMAGEWIPLQSSLIKSSSFFKIGGFNPYLLATQDVDICRRINLHGDLAETTALTACVEMGFDGSSTDHQNASTYSRQGRESILNQKGVLTRLNTSGRSRDLYGRIPRIYLTSTIWNFQHGRFFTAISRLLFGTFTLLQAIPYFPYKQFWQGLIHSYESPTFRRGFIAAEHQDEYHES